MSRDHLTVIAIAGGWSAAIGLIGLVCVWFARRRSLRWVFVSVALVGVVGIVAGVVATARAMFLSQHDYEVVLWVVAVAGVVTLVFAWLVARLTLRRTRALQAAARAIGDDGRFVPPDDAGELADLRVS